MVHFSLGRVRLVHFSLGSEEGLHHSVILSRKGALEGLVRALCNVTVIVTQDHEDTTDCDRVPIYR